MEKKRLLTYAVIALAVFFIFRDCSCGSGYKTDEKEESVKTVEEEVKVDATYLMDVSEPSEYKSARSGKEAVPMVGGLEWKGGFRIENGGFVTFPIDDDYESIHFVLGQYANWNEWGDNFYNTDPTVVTVWADKKKIYDGLVYYDAVPQFVTAEIKGAESLTFKIAQGPGSIAFGEVTLWKKKDKPQQLTNLIKDEPKTIELVKDLQPYYFEAFYPVGVGHSVKGTELDGMKINSVEYEYGLVASIGMDLIGENKTKSHFYLRRQYSKLSFIAGAVDGRSHGSGWLSVQADGRTIYEQEVTHDGIAKQVVLDIEGCDQLTFCTKHGTGDGVYCGVSQIMVYPEGEGRELRAGNVSDAPVDDKLKELPDVTKLMSSVKPFAIGSDTNKQLYKGESDYITFSMGGTRFSEGFILYEMANFMDDNLSSYVIFDLGNEFDHVRFTVGYVGKSWTMYNDVLRVYADDELILETPLIATLPNREFILPLNKCRKLRFENKGQGTMDVSAYGIADLVLYRGEDTSENPFVHPRPECPQEIELLDLGKPYIHYVALGTDHERLLDGSTKSKYFPMGDEKVYKGFSLCTSVHFSLDFGPLGAGGGAAAAAGALAAGVSFVPLGAAVGGTVVGSTLIGAASLLMLAAGGTAVENSCAAFNTYGEYNSLTFTVGCSKPAFSDNYTGYPETLLIGVNGEVAYEIALYDNMTPQTVTLPIEGCEQLMFWLVNTNEGWSGEFVFYDLKLSKKKQRLSIPSELGGVKPVISKPAWDAPESIRSYRVGRAAVSGYRNLDKFIYEAEDLHSGLTYILDKGWPSYMVTTTFVKSKRGKIYKAVRLVEHERGENFRFYDSPLNLEEAVYPKAVEQLEYIQKLHDEEYKPMNSFRKGANSDIRSLSGSSLEKYQGYLDKANAMAEKADTLMPMLMTQKTEEIAYLKKIMDTRVDEIDGKKSTAFTHYCELWKTDKLPDDKDYILPIEKYNPKDE